MKMAQSYFRPCVLCLHHSLLQAASIEATFSRLFKPDAIEEDTHAKSSALLLL